MSSYAIISDTDCSLPAELAARHGIHQVPINIHFGQETLRTGVEIDDAELFARVAREGRLPTTSAPSPGQFIEAYQAAFDAGPCDGVICFCVSGEASATYSAALEASRSMPGRDITVVDTRVSTMAQGFMVLAAAEVAEEGATKDEIIAHAMALRERTHLYAALSTLKYLAMSGRVGQLAAGVATLLDVKPLLTMREGRLELLERVRAQSRAWSRVIELAARAAGGRPAERMAIVHANAYEQARQFERQLRVAMRCPDEIIVAELTPGLSVVSGPGLVGVVFVSYISAMRS